MRKTDCYPGKFQRALNCGLVREDARAGRIKLFDSRRLPEIAAALNGGAK